MTWYEITDPADPELDRLAEQYHIHPLHIEDCRHRDQNAKIEENGGYVFIVLKPVRMTDKGEIDVVDLDVILGKDFVITVEESQCPSARALLERIRKTGEERPDRLLYRIFDGVVDNYLAILDHYSEAIDKIEDEVLERPEPTMLQQIFENKRALIEMRRTLAQTRDVGGHLQRTDCPFIGKDLMPFFRDVYDHLVRDLDTVEMLRDLLTGSLDIYLSSVANRTNQVMKVLTVLGTIALPSLILSSFYGMNVKGLPYADTPHALWIVVVAMVASTGGLLWMLRRFKWF
jgi:magnesium transporter